MEYVTFIRGCCRSPGKIINIAIPTFEALTQFGVAAVTIKNTGEVEASYSLTVIVLKTEILSESVFFLDTFIASCFLLAQFDCSKGVAFVEVTY